MEPSTSCRDRQDDLHWRLRAISPTTHKTLWSSTGQGGPFDTTPAVAPDGVVYVAMDGRGGKGLYAIENGGTELWERSFHDGGLDVSPTIGPDGTVYIEDEDSKVYALNPENGHAYWKFTGSDRTFLGEGTPALSPDGTTVYLTTAGGDLYAVSAGPTGGQLAWTYHIQGPQGGGIANAPAVGPDGTIYVATAGNNGNTPGDIEAVNPDGTLKWAYVSNGTFETTPAVTAAGQVVAGNDVGTVVAVQQSDGALAWSYSAPGVYGQNGFIQFVGGIGRQRQHLPPKPGQRLRLQSRGFVALDRERRWLLLAHAGRLWDSLRRRW